MVPLEPIEGIRAYGMVPDYLIEKAEPAKPAVATTAPSAEEADAPKQQKKSRKQLRKNNLLFAGIFAAVLAIFAGGVVFADSYDNDVWFFLATGKEIIENGIPQTNPFSIHDDMLIVVQQWLICVLSYMLFSSTGFVGLGVLTLLLFCVLTVLLYVLGRIARGDKYGGEWLLLALIPICYGMSSYMSVRPHLYSMIMFTLVMIFLELYRRKNKWLLLLPLPFIVVLHVNIQMAMAPFDLVVIACYAIPDVLKPFHRRGRLKDVRLAGEECNHYWLLGVLAVCAAALLVNPYGIDGALYLVNSYGAADYHNYISEMQQLAPASSATYAIAIAMTFVAAVCIGRKGLKAVNLPLIILILGTVVMAFQHIRNIWLPCLFCYVYIAWFSRGHSISLLKGAARNPLSAILPGAVGLAVAIVLAIGAVPALKGQPADDSYTPVSAMDYLVDTGINPDEVKVFSFFNSGGYIEYRGFRVNIDPRPELWAPGISHSANDYYAEYIDMATGETIFEDYMEKYGFDVYIIPKDQKANDLFKGNWDYKSIPSGSDYNAYAKRDLGITQQ